MNTLFTHNNGKYLGLIKILCKFDPVIIEHLRQIKNNVTHVLNLGSRIQNNLVESVVGEFKREIITKIKLAKYFAIITD